MARRKRYKELEQVLTRILIADVAIFVLYLIFAGLGLTVVKVLTAIIAIVVSGLALVFLYMCGEFQKRRSRWLVLGYACTVICLVVSLVLNYPSPKPNSIDQDNPSASTSSTEGTDAPTDLPTETTGETT